MKFPDFSDNLQPPLLIAKPSHYDRWIQSYETIFKIDSVFLVSGTADLRCIPPANLP